MKLIGKLTKARGVFIIVSITVLLGFAAIAFAQKPTSSVPPIVIGICTSLGFLEGYECKYSIEMAVDEINAKGGVKVGGEMRPFKIVEADSRDSEPGLPVSEALMAYEKLILSHKPHAIIPGFFTSEATLASMDITTKYKIPYLATIAMSPKFQEKILENYEAYKYNFRLSYNSVFFANAYLGVLKMINEEFGFNSAFILNEEALWAKAIAGIAQKWLEGQGWKVNGVQTYPKGMSDFSAPLLNIKNSKTQVIIFISSRPETVTFADQWRSMKIPALLTGMLPPLCSEESWQVHKGKVKGIIAIAEPSIIPVNAVPASEKFYAAYKKKVGKAPGSSHGPGPAYDSVYILKEAIERAGTLDGDKLVEEIKKTDRKGVVGRMRFGKDHQVPYGTNPNEEGLLIDFQWQDPGKRVIIYPKAVATGKIQLPPWMEKK
jgi:branched-chain amino acid transport system substrate-binding protein